MVEKPKMGSTGHRERLRDRFRGGSPEAYTQAALLELLLTFAIPQKDVRPLAEALLAQFGDLSAVLQADWNSLSAQKGIGEQTATMLKLVHWLGVHQLASPAVAATGAVPEDVPQLHEPPSVREEDHQSTELPVAISPIRTYPKTREPGLFSNAALKEAIDLLPQMPPILTPAGVRAFFRDNLHYSAAETRERYGGYIARRLFPSGVPDQALQRFARAYSGRRELLDVCYYRFCAAEPIMYSVAEDYLIPAIGAGQALRSDLRAYLAQRFPTSKNIGNGAKGIVEALTAAGIVRSTPTTLRFGYREVPLASFAFVLNSEFPSGMYDIAKLEQNRAVRAMLWHPDRLVSALYELRNARLISKVSEIDSVRQFTTRLSLDELVDELVPVGAQA